MQLSQELKELLKRNLKQKAFFIIFKLTQKKDSGSLTMTASFDLKSLWEILVFAGIK